MTKKKSRQADPGSPGEDDSSESGEDHTQAGGKPCPHTARAVDFNAVRKNIVKAQIKEVCAECSKDPPSKATTNKQNEESVDKEDGEATSVQETPVEDEGPGGMWLCLRCGYQGCGPPSKRCSHIGKHFCAPRSDCHALSTNTEQWSVWCQECDCEVAANSTKKLHECIEFLKRQPKACSNTVTVVLKSRKPAVMEENEVEVAQEALPSQTVKRPSSKTVTLAAVPPSSPTNLHPRVKGLSNLGNTCFFNAVLQCLAQTPFLVNLLKETAEEGETFSLPGCPEGGKDQEPVPALEGTLGSWGSLTEALADTLAEMQEPGGSGVVTPRRLLSLVSQRAPHLGQGDQQDSQELLRHLMEGDRILVSVGLSRKTDPATVDDNTKAKAKVYNHQASQLLLRPDQLFQGRLISTLQCQDCKRQSHTPECFLDLSLPIASDRPQPPLVLRTAKRDSREESTEPKEKEAPSKHQQKKERRLAHKNRKKRGSRQNSEEPAENEKDGNNSEESKQSDADVEDNEDQDKQDEPLDLRTKPLDLSIKSPSTYEDLKPVMSPIAVDVLGVAHCAEEVKVEDRGGGESGYATNGGTHSNSPGSPTSATEEADHAHASALCSELESLALGGDVAKEEQTEKQTVDKVSTSRFSENLQLPLVHTSSQIRAISIFTSDVYQSNNIMDTEKDEAVPQPEEEQEGACALEPPPEEEDEDENSVLWSQTLAPRPPPCEQEGDCSIQSCLNQFAAIELLTGNNRVSCKTCTQRAGKSAQGKTVCTNSTKQLLVSAPPAILTLHLKRFEVYGSRFRKVSRTVSFPLLLDLAPICSTKCRSRLLYSLYGVVEHSGGLAGGHYVAYVKARTQPDKDDPRYKFLLNNSWETRGGSADQCNSIQEDQGAEGGLPEPPAGKWYYISDSRVSEVSEKKVLQTQAYLLFYERIM
ncbi:hypothetical protein B566_EDAN007822 [Ephemera danica]|nr:hypothetical protein B566_EDAN007822 [Ephemera danica]